jgi:hypothetical protein
MVFEAVISEKAPCMSQLSRRAIATPASTRFIAIASVLGATLLFNPLTAAADPVAPQIHHHARRAGAAAAAESVEQRIASLHAALKITSAEEANWRSVAQVMRDNELRMQGLIAETAALPAHDVSAVESLKTYEHFTQTHVDGLKMLISSFETLYNTMPDDQKRLADHVFQRLSHARESRG